MSMDLNKIDEGAYLTNDVSSVIVESEAKLAVLAGAEPGTIAYTPGFASMWQMSTDGETWKKL